MRKDGPGYTASLEVRECSTGNRLVLVRFDAPQSNQVVVHLGTAATQLRGDLGETDADLNL